MQPLRLQPSYGAGGFSELPVFLVHLEIPIKDAVATTTIEFEYEAVGVPDLERSIEALNLQKRGRNVRLIGLLGRDIMRHITMLYDGPAGRYKLRFDLAGLSKPSSAQSGSE